MFSCWLWDGSSHLVLFVQLVRYEAESPDELALAEAALAYGYELRNRSPDEVELGIRGELSKMKVIRVQQFDATRKCMSVAMRQANGQVSIKRLIRFKVDFSSGFIIRGIILNIFYKTVIGTF